jgi:lysophospholipase L1-like esterase
MKFIWLYILIICASLQADIFAQSKSSEVQYENIEWTRVWIPSAAKSDLPRVLLIGNSITQGYYPVVEEMLKGKAYVARYTTSRGIADPALFNEIENLISQHKFDIIHFNNGLHGIGYEADVYKKGLEKLVKQLKRHGQGAVLIGATSTRVLPGFSGWKSDEFNDALIRTRNEIVKEVCSDRGIAVNDLYAVTANNPELFSEDKIHYKKEGYTALGKQAVSYVLEALAK